MAKIQKARKVSGTVRAANAIAAATPAVAAAKPAAKLTKRNATPTTAVLIRTDKTPKDRAPHTKAAWAVLEAALPATAAELIAALEEAKFDEVTKTKLVSFPAYISYMIRRKALAPKD